MTKKFMEVVKRQTELAAKAAAGEATELELAELKKLNVAIKAATDPVDPKIDTTLKTMTLAEFREWHETAVKSLEDGVADPALLAIVKRNLAAVKDQGKTLADDVVAVEMPVEKSEAEVVASLEQRIADLEAKLDGSSNPPADGAEKGDKPTAQALAMEAIDTLLANYTKLKAAIDSGSLTKEDLEGIWFDYELKRVIEQAAAIMKKADELKEMVAVVMPELEKLDKAENGGDGGDPPADPPAEDPPAEGDDGKDGAEKGEPSNWTSGLDIAPKRTAKEQHQDMKSRKEKFGY